MIIRGTNSIKFRIMWVDPKVTYYFLYRLCGHSKFDPNMTTLILNPQKMHWVLIKAAAVAYSDGLYRKAHAAQDRLILLKYFTSGQDDAQLQCSRQVQEPFLDDPNPCNLTKRTQKIL